MTGRDPLDPGAQTQHLLSRERSQDIFARHIAPTLLAGGQPQDRPQVVLLSGQPAAGKTTITQQLLAQHAAAGGAVDVNVDRFIAFHPDLPTLQAADELTAEDLVHADARRWLDRSIDHLTGRRVNIVLEHGLRSPEVTDALLARFAAADYRVEAALLATARAQSLLANLARYQTAHEATGAGRFVLTELHDARYTGLLDVADRLQDDPRVDALTVYRRDGTPLHRNTREPHDGPWTDPARLRQVIQTERDRPWTLEQSREFLTLHARLTQQLTPQPGQQPGPSWTLALRAARDAAAPLMHPRAAPTPPDTLAGHRGSVRGHEPRPTARPTPAPPTRPSPAQAQPPRRGQAR